LFFHRGGVKGQAALRRKGRSTPPFPKNGAIPAGYREMGGGVILFFITLGKKFFPIYRERKKELPAKKEGKLFL